MTEYLKTYDICAYFVFRWCALISIFNMLTDWLINIVKVISECFDDSVFIVRMLACWHRWLAWILTPYAILQFCRTASIALDSILNLVYYGSLVIFLAIFHVKSNKTKTEAQPKQSHWPTPSNQGLANTVTNNYPKPRSCHFCLGYSEELLHLFYWNQEHMLQKQAGNHSEMGSKLQRDNVTFNNKSNAII